MTLQQRADVDEGLKAASEMPVSVKEIDLEALGMWNQVDGVAAKLEASYHPWKNVTFYGAGTWSESAGAGAEVGAKLGLAW